MTIELVDGHGGKPHISGEDLGDFKAGILGDAGYVFKRANMLAATLNGSNSITIATGSGIMPTSGRHFRVTAPETLAITSGTQGQNRNDLIVVRATTDEESTTVETATLVVLRGTPTSGTATDPATQDGDLPLYRLQLKGVSVAEPIALFDAMVPYSEFRDSISHYSTTETPTGKTWIDGKPIYCKVIVMSGFTGNATSNIAHGISSIGDVVDFRFYLKNPTGELILPVPRIGYVGSDFNESFSNYAYISKTNIVFTRGSSSSYSSGYAIIEYTKA